MLMDDAIPFRLCSNKNPLRNRNSKCKRNNDLAKVNSRLHLLSNNPQPLYVKHFYDFNNLPICGVKDCQIQGRMDTNCEDEYGRIHPYLVETNTLNGLPVFRFRHIPKIHKAIPKLGLVEIKEPWRFELKALTETVLAPIIMKINPQMSAPKFNGLTEYHPYPIGRPITAIMARTRRENHDHDCIVTARSPSQQSRRTYSRSSRSSTARTLSSYGKDDSYFWNDQWSSDYESQVFSLLGQILQLSDVESIKKWLGSASDREKATIMGILESVFRAKLEKTTEFDSCKNYDLPQNEVEEHTDEIDRLILESRKAEEEEQEDMRLCKRPQTTRSCLIRPQTTESCMSTNENGQSKGVVKLRYKTASTRSHYNKNERFNLDLINAKDDFSILSCSAEPF